MSSSLAKRKTEKGQEIIRKLGLEEDNRVCMDCTLKSTPYVVLDFGTFVCTYCAGIHRSYQFNAKGISMTNFKDSEVDVMVNGGNKKAERTYRARWSEKEAPKPKVQDEQAVKNFIYKTYVKKIWFEGSGSSASPSNTRQQQREDDIPPVRPIQQLIQNPAKIEVEKTVPSRGRNNSSAQKDSSLFFTEDQPVTKPVSKPAPKPSSGGLGDFFDDFNPAPTKAPQNNANNGFGDDDFQADFPDDNAPTTKAPAKRGLDFANDLFANVPAPAPTNQFGGGFNQFGGGFGGQQGGFQQGGFGGQQGGFGGQQQFGGQQGGFGGQQQFGGQQGGFGGHPQNQFGNQQGGFGGQQGGFGGQQQFGGQQGFGGHPQQQFHQGGQFVTSPQQGGFGGQQGGFVTSPQQQQFGGHPQQGFHQGGPQMNPAFAQQQQQQPKNDPNDHLFSDLGMGFKPSTQPVKSPQQVVSPQMRPTQPSPQQWNQPQQNTAHDDNPFDF